MPIIAIEGPDKCGKSTLFAELQKLAWFTPVQFIDPPTFGKDRMHIAYELALRELEMWETFYRPEMLYISNRHVLVTDRVYSTVYSRKMLRSSFLSRHVYPVYIDVPVDELMRRHAASNEEIQDPSKYGIVRGLYNLALQRFHCITVEPTTTPEEVQKLIVKLVLELAHGR